eukprot:13340-Pleurochrysis_carterae.AAC.1
MWAVQEDARLPSSSGSLPATLRPAAHSVEDFVPSASLLQLEFCSRQWCHLRLHRLHQSVPDDLIDRSVRAASMPEMTVEPHCSMNQLHDAQQALSQQEKSLGQFRR